jgi:hypothetical protein
LTFKEGFPSGAGRTARKKRIMNYMNTQAASNELAVPDRLSFVHRMRYNERAVKKSLSFPKLDLNRLYQAKWD